MTADQAREHWVMWGAVCRHHGWKMSRGRLQGDPTKLNHFSRKVWDQASTLAGGAARAADVDDLRHALYYLSCGQVSSGRINPGHHTTQLFGWLRLCLDDADVEAARMAGQTAAGHTGQLSGPIAIRRLGFPESYIASIAKSMYAGQLQGGSWESLPVPTLRKLYKLLRSRQRRQS